MNRLPYIDEDPGAQWYLYDPDKEDLRLDDGRKLTTDVMEELATYAEKHGPRIGLRPGGKSLSGGKKHSPQVTVTLSETTNKQLRQRAASEKMSVSRWTRRLIERELTA